MDIPNFLLGAGFNKDAQQLAGPIMGRSIYIGEYQIECGYPLVSDLWQLCFTTETVDVNSSIELQFQRAVEERNWEPLKKLYEELMKADYYFIPALLPNDAKPDSCYASFFRDFQGVSFLTFNYDSLPEVFLSRMGRWYPHDGYGVPVEAELEPYVADTFPVGSSSSLVLHLHGSLCISTSEFEVIPSKKGGMDLISPLDVPKFHFDPHSITHLFSNYRRGAFDPFNYEDIEERVIAPIPDKAQGLRKNFIRAIHSKAKSLISESNMLVTIGYDFNPHDKVSYSPILNRFAQQDRPTGILVSPNAIDIKRRLSMEYPSIEWLECNATFRQWVESGYRGLR